jgi:tetraacyldisaccharide 4'-kinase
MPPEQRRDIARTLPPGLPLFFTAFEYGEPEAVFTGSRDGDGLPETENCLLLTGIANPAPLERHLQEQGRQIVQRLAFRDHHAFTPADVRRITAAARCWNGAPVFTTEKDAVRLRETSGWPDDVRRRLFFLPITVRFLPEETPPAPEGSRRQQELFKQIIIKKLWNAPPKPSNSF